MCELPYGNGQCGITTNDIHKPEGMETAPHVHTVHFPNGADLPIGTVVLHTATQYACDIDECTAGHPVIAVKTHQGWEMPGVIHPRHTVNFIEHGDYKILEQPPQ